VIVDDEAEIGAGTDISTAGVTTIVSEEPAIGRWLRVFEAILKKTQDKVPNLKSKKEKRKRKTFKSTIHPK
jgi:hypothetical protein